MENRANGLGYQRSWSINLSFIVALNSHNGKCRLIA
jgi:hypothetical protein